MKKLVVNVIILLCISTALFACSTTKVRYQRLQSDMINSGSITLSRTVPAISSGGDGILGGLMSLSPTIRDLSSNTTPTLIVDRKNNEITFTNSNNSKVSLSGSVSASMHSGNYRVVLKQSDPSWYAPAEYFTNRGVTVPPEGSKDRSRRGALGEYAAFLDNGSAIHTSPLWIPEIGGVRLEGEDQSAFFQNLPVGTLVIIN